MRWRAVSSFGDSANAAASRVAARVDDQTGEVSARLAQVITVAVRVLRLPTAVLLAVPIPFIAATLVLAAMAEGALRPVGLVVGLLMAAVSAAFWGRRRRILAAVSDPKQLATELAIMVTLTDKVDETRGALAQIGGGGGARVFSRLQGVWNGATMPGRWIEQVGDLPRARYFAPPKIGTTVTVTIAALWLVPVSVVVAIIVGIGSLASVL
jgi:hypothetical protein